MSDQFDDKKNEDNYEEVCFSCHRPESKAGKMMHLPPNNMCICSDCMRKSLDSISNMDLGNLFPPGMANLFGGNFDPSMFGGLFGPGMMGSVPGSGSEGPSGLSSFSGFSSSGCSGSDAERSAASSGPASFGVSAWLPSGSLGALSLLLPGTDPIIPGPKRPPNMEGSKFWPKRFPIPGGNRFPRSILPMESRLFLMQSEQMHILLGGR